MYKHRNELPLMSISPVVSCLNNICFWKCIIFTQCTTFKQTRVWSLCCVVISFSNRRLENFPILCLWQCTFIEIRIPHIFFRKLISFSRNLNLFSLILKGQKVSGGDQSFSTFCLSNGKFHPFQLSYCLTFHKKIKRGLFSLTNEG